MSAIQLFGPVTVQLVYKNCYMQSDFLYNPKIRKYKEGFSAKSYIRCMHDGLECILSVSIVKRAVMAHDFDIGCFFLWWLSFKS